METRVLKLRVPSASGIAVYPPGATFGPRRMRDWEFVWIIAGNVEYTLGQKTFAAPQGSIVLCRPGDVDGFVWDKRHATRHAFFHFDILEVATDLPPTDTWPVVVAPAAGDVLVPMFQHLLTWIGRGDTSMIASVIEAMIRVTVAGQRAMHELPGSIEPDAVRLAFAYVHKTLESDPAAEITLADLASAGCVTPEHLCRLFKHASEHSPMETVRLARLDHAAVLLTRSNFSVGQIAVMCGFASQFHFARRFKEAFGATATQVRRQVRDGHTPPLPRLLKRR